VRGETAHRALREMLGAYVLGQLDYEDWAALDTHLPTCAQCRADLDEIRPVAELLSATRDRISVERDEPEYVPPLSPQLVARVRAGTRFRRVALAAAAAAVLLVGGGVGYVAGGQSQAVPQEAVAVQALAPGVQASAGLVAHTWGMEVKLVATGFEPGRPYRVTVTDDQGRTVGAGEFVGTGAQEMRCNLNSSVLRAAAASFEVTDAGGQVVLDALI
jgi:predicted anti-sigma-YlaC factor YlaD